MKLRRSIYAQPVIVRGRQCTRGATCSRDRSAATGDVEAFGARSPACSLSAICQHASLAMPCATGRRLNLSVRTSWDDVVRSIVLGSRVWGPHSLHTAEVTGSIPVTPTSQNAFQPRPSGSFARRFARGPGSGKVDLACKGSSPVGPGSASVSLTTRPGRCRGSEP
jgi:hypothetical protein